MSVCHFITAKTDAYTAILPSGSPAPSVAAFRPTATVLPVDNPYLNPPMSVCLTFINLYVWH
ncbi:hypothetical protein GALMADRAFT_229016 [Galerina marginata CBS 339.88]|uniref:Uncharacterized protein n=1 Tax=Galerina marginata (strain CBS 339.88) TaxID=685588 RepID=A0A067SPB7_GALM3|nr:hypothetical protein GALMADRAFT_229016 [Galerina marginata CBS 339.88]